MTRCKDCDREVVKGTLQCPGCGSRIEAAESLTSTRRFDDFHSQPTPDSAGRPQQAAASSTPSDDDAPIPMPSMSEIPGKPRSVTQATEVQFLPPQTEGERFTPGRVLADRYLILGRIGEGAMGEVYRAEDRRLGGQVALKFLSEGAAADADGLKRLLTEAHLARQITHPNVCRVFDVGDVDGHTFISMEFISMEYIDGETFSSLLRRIGRLPADKALSVAHQMCAGLAWAHERGILHRDLKPANVMLDGGGEVKIADFGLAGLAEELRKDKHRAGTPAYMSPERPTCRRSSCLVKALRFAATSTRSGWCCMNSSLASRSTDLRASRNWSDCTSSPFHARAPSCRNCHRRSTVRSCGAYHVVPGA